MRASTEKERSNYYALFTTLTGIAAGVLLATTVQANEPLNVEIHKVSADGVEESIGTVAVEHTEHGVLLTPRSPV